MGEMISRHVVVAIPDAINRGGNAGQQAARKQGDDAGGAFSRSLRDKLTAAFKAMPKLNVRLGDTGVNAELDRIRAKLETLSQKRIGIDVDAGVAEAEITRLEEQLRRLGAEHPNVQVRADTATARAALAEIRAEIASVDADDPTIRVKADTAGASSALMALGIQAAALTAIPAIPVALAGLGGIASMATAAGAGLGALALAGIPAVKGVTEALKAKTAAQADDTTSTNGNANAARQAAQKAIQMAGAQATLTTAHRNAARSIAQANEQVATSERTLAQAVQRAADQKITSAESVSRAERTLADAQRAARQAETDLTTARKDAAEQLRSLNDQLNDGLLSQRDATLRVQEAQAELKATIADPKSTRLQIERAKLAADQALQNAHEQKQSYAELQKSAAAQQKAGIDGNAGVVRATQGVADAQRNVKDQAQAVADAQREASRAQQAAAQAVADAQRGVSDAVKSAANAQVSANESIASAERGLASARLSGNSATAKTVTKADELRKALAQLTPEQKDLYDSIAGPKGLKGAFSDWSKSLQPETLPLFTRGVNSAKDALPSLTPLVKGAADAVGVLWDKASKNVKTPFWQGFKKDIDKSVKPAILGLGTAFGNIITGIAGIIDAFLPHMDGIVDRSDKITGRFAKWGKSLKGSPDFEKFLGYVKANAPGLASFIGGVLRAALDLSKAIAPLSQTMFKVLKPLLDAISWIAVHMPGAVQLLWGMYAAMNATKLATIAFTGIMVAYRAGMVLATLLTEGWTAAVVASNLAFEANPIVAIITIIVAALALVAAGVIYAYKHFGWFHDAVNAAWDGIKIATLFLWNQVLKPTFDAIVWAVKGTGDAAMWLWQNAITPAFHGIEKAVKAVGDAAMWLWNNGIKPAFDFINKAIQILVTALLVVLIAPAILAFKLLAYTAKLLWNDGIKPVFGWIGDKAKWLYDKAIKPQFKAIHDTIHNVGDAAKWLYNKAIEPAFGWIADKAKWLWDKGVKPQFKALKDGVHAVGDAAKWLWEKAISPAFDYIADGAKWLYNKGIKPQFKFIKDAISSLSDSFDTGRKNIKKAWDQISGIAKAPVKFIIDHVYNAAIVPLWNHVADITGAKHLNDLKLKGYATGGVIPGYTPGRDNQIIAVGGGEAIMRPEVTRAVGAGRIHALNAAARGGGVAGVQRAISAGMPAFADGGIVGWLKSVGGKAGDIASDVAGYLDPMKLFGKVLKSVKSIAKPIEINPWAKQITAMPVKMIGDLKEKALSSIGFGDGPSEGGGNGGSGVQRWKSVVLQALSMLHQSPAWLDTVLRRMNQESGGNPRAINNWDINAQHGDPSRGLMQTIGSTFNAYAGQLRGRGIYDPLANVYAGLNYAIHRYGSLSALNRPGGYASGGFPGVGELAWVGENGPELVRFLSPAQVYSHGDSMNIVANGMGSGGGSHAYTASQYDDMRASKSGAVAPNIVVQSHTYLGTSEITDILDHRIEIHDSAAAGDLNTGRRI